jgi:hypothetical protein
MILATDLDGTFLGGDEAARTELYDLIRATAESTLIFVTGRGLGSIQPLLEDPAIPDPHYIIADVGATVVRRARLEPVAEIQDAIEAVWPGAERVRSALSPFEFLVYQDVPQERRCSFLLAEERRITRSGMWWRTSWSAMSCSRPAGTWTCCPGCLQGEHAAAPDGARGPGRGTRGSGGRHAQRPVAVRD